MWPSQEKVELDVPDEMKACVLFHGISFTTPSIDIHVTARWGRLIRIAASVIRFINNCRRKAKSHPIFVSKASSSLEVFVKKTPKCILKPLCQEELRAGEIILLKQAQRDGFPEEVRTLEERRDSNSWVLVEKSSWLYQLRPIINTDGVVRMSGRLALAEEIPFDQKFPIILPRRHGITEMIIQSYHERFGHANRETVFNELRQRLYIPKLRSVITTVVKNCTWCRVKRSQPKNPLMAPLPVQRVTRPLRPFCSVGVDYLGPIEVSVGRRKEKRWVALFTCLAVRAVHLEVVHTLSTQACLMAIRRFICRRGSPDEFFSDNETNFRGASKEMSNTVKKINVECTESVTSPTIKWHFIPPGTPHMGGAWERMVQSVKEAMEAFNDGRKLTDEILLTTLSEAEDMINTRPLTYSSQESELKAITPNHLLRCVVKEADSTIEHVDLAESLRNLHKRSQYLADRMWQRWCKEYLPGINRRTKWYEDQKALKVGDMVFVVDGEHRKNWVHGVVEEVIEGADGNVRQAMVRTTKGVFRRAVANLAVVEIAGKTGIG
ncbi:uncharacterized protein LOC129766188 [Toxorhynchites rutilus septentrionalis]|uniref:uncharacterized protein LOC129766188 n=1 Tax=Toxorhynchites rutilus septentrionalis TaxID=329112 RepID=UPI0024797607|nr:uncharacterized protein LOC129766188 [Toxorhynchites rutilus septentrionalis]